MSVRARTIVGLLVVLTAQSQGPAHGEDPKLETELEIEGKDYKDGTFVGRTLHTLKLAPNQLASLTFDLEAIAENKVRLTVTSTEDRPLTFRSVAIPADGQGRAISAQPSNNRLEVVGDKIRVSYDRPKDWWVLASAEAGGDGRLAARILPRVTFARPSSSSQNELRARCVTVTVAEREDGLSLTVAPAP